MIPPILAQPFWLRYGCGVKTITIKDIPPALHRELKKRAEAHGRSLNTEVLACLEASVRATPVDTEQLLRDLRAVRERTKAYLTEADLKRFKNEGRP